MLDATRCYKSVDVFAVVHGARQENIYIFLNRNLKLFFVDVNFFLENSNC